MSAVAVSSSPSGSQVYSDDLWSVTVRLVSARQLKAADLFTRSSDPYALLRLDGVERRSRVVHKSLNPHWQQTFTWISDAKPKTLRVEVCDWDQIGKHDSLGGCELQLDQLPSSSQASSDNSGASNVEQSWMGELKLSGPNIKSGSIDLSVLVSPIPNISGRASSELAGVRSLDDCTALVELKLVGAEQLGAKDDHVLKPRNDPFATVSFGLTSFKTKTVPSNNSPQWNQLVPLWITKSDNNAKALIKIAVYDYERIGKAELLGNAYIRPADLQLGHLYDVKLPLTKHNAVTDAQLSVLVQDFANQTAVPPLASGPASATPAAVAPQPAVSFLPSCADHRHGVVHVHLIVKPREQVEKEFYAQLINDYDSDGNQRMSLEEITHMLTTLGVQLSQEDLAKAFESADKSKSGGLGVEDLGVLFRTPQFESKSALRSLYAMVTHGAEALDTLLMQGCLTANPHSKSAALTADADPTNVDNEGTQILVQDRDTGLLVRENIPAYIKSALVLLNRTAVGQLASSKIAGTIRTLTLRAGKTMDNPKSKRDIPNFVKLHRLNVSEIEKPLEQYATFNEFFYRKLKPGARICAFPDDAAHAVSPADCRLMVFPSIEESQRLWIKGRNFNVANLFGDWDRDGSKAAQFNGGALAIARLAPQDYHRYHFPVSGQLLSKRHLINGGYQTVSPIAVRRDVDVYTTNKRSILPIETQEFGTVLLIAIAATMVGGIGFECSCALKPVGAYCCDDGRCQLGRAVRKFDDCGFFAFGGSTTLVLFQPGAVTFDSDLLKNSGQQLETLVKVGASLGRATGKYKKPSQ